jgi:predicted dehydrogenase
MSNLLGDPFRVGIVGCGLIGRKRAEALGRDQLVASYDVVPEVAESLARDHGGKACSTLEELLDLDLDVVVVATIHSELASITCKALESGAHVLVEKPAGIGVADIDRISDAAKRASRLVKVGFNHRFHPGIARAITEARSGIHGDILYLRGRYGHGGRLGYDKEWRADPALSGGGEIVDQGMHLLDLSYWLLGELPLHSSLTRTQFWQAPVDDNAVLLLGNKGGVGSTDPFALLHVSWTEWKNTFSLEIACHDAKLAVDGLVRSYGPQTLRVYRMRPELGPPDVEEVRYPDRDGSWDREWSHFVAAIAAADGRPLLGDLASARFAWSCVEAAQQR